MRPACNATPGLSTTSHVPLRNRNINKRRLEDAEDGRVEKAKRQASSREEGQGREKKRRRKRKRKSSVVSTTSENIPFVPTLSVHRQNTLERRSRRDGSDDEDTRDSLSKQDSKASHGAKETGSRVKSPIDSSADTIARLKEQLEAQKQLVKKHQEFFTQVQQSVSCQICLDLMSKPYALAPCGHIACYNCLVAWFTTEPADGRPVLPVHFRKKTCPHCRAVVREAPVAAWSVKGIVAGMAKSGIVPGLTTSQATDSEDGVPPMDAWSHIFKPIPGAGNGVPVGGNDLGFYDAEDGGIYRCLHCMHEIWEDTCSFCGHLYPGHQVDEAHDIDDGPDYLNDMLENAPELSFSDHEREIFLEEAEEEYERLYMDHEGIGWRARRMESDYYPSSDEEHEYPLPMERVTGLDLEDEPEEEYADHEEMSPRRSNRALRRLVVSDDEELDEPEMDESDQGRDSTPLNSGRLLRSGRVLPFESDRDSSVTPPRIRLAYGRRIETDDEESDGWMD